MGYVSQYNALLVLGGPTAVIKLAIEREAGNKFKLKQLRQHIVDNIKKKNETQIIKKPEPRLIFWNVGCPNCSTLQKMQMSASVRRGSGCGKTIKRDAWPKIEKPSLSPGEELKE
jgi:ribosomal protein S27E